MLTPNEVVFIFEGFYVCANVSENSLRNASVRLRADGHTDRGKPEHSLDRRQFWHKQNGRNQIQPIA